MIFNEKQKRIFKYILFKIVPYKYIRAFLKNVNLNALMFSYADIKDSQYIVKDTNYAFRYYGMEEELGYQVMSGLLTQTMTYINAEKLQTEYIIDGGKCYIEPKHGWGVQFGTRKVIRESIIYNRQRENYFPSYIDYRFRKAKKTKYFPQVVSIRIISGGERNYWHFLIYMLGVIVLLDRNNFPKDIPIVIPKKLADQKFFKEMVNYAPDLQSRNWVIQDGEYILADHVFFSQKMPNRKDQFTGLLELLQIPDADTNKRRKVFVKRSPERIRFIKNGDEIQDIAVKNGYEVIDCDNMSFNEQVSIFSQASHVIGIHGAGLANIVWRKNAPLTLLELFPADYIHPAYFWHAKSFDKKYAALVGSEILPDTSFSIDPAKFEQKLATL